MLDPTSETARELAEKYKQLLREAKRDGVSFDDAPLEVREAQLALHQNALAVHWESVKNKRRRKKEAGKWS